MSLPRFCIRLSRRAPCDRPVANQPDLATVACALERYRIAESRYPEKLDPLVPRFIATLPTDVMNGKPLNYFRTEGDQFVLYSVGWNEADEGGEVMRLGRGGIDPKEGDWVWQYPDR
jgi:hypothetical protein